MRVIGTARTALERQTREAVRIRRRGGEGSILNSKAEFNRCYIPRLKLEEQDIEKMEQQEQSELNSINERLRGDAEEWEQAKNKTRELNNRAYAKKLGRSKKSLQTKNPLEEQSKEQKGNKRRKYELVVPGWGASTEIVLNKKKEDETATLTLTNPAPSSSQDCPDVPKLPELPQISQPRHPDNNSHITERYEKGFPPVQLAPSEEQLHAGCLGEVTLRGGTVTSPTPHSLPPKLLPSKGEKGVAEGHSKQGG